MTEGEAIQSLRTEEDGTLQTTSSEPGLPLSNAPVNDANQDNAIEDNAAQEEPDVLPAPLNALLACLWVLLFSGRWLLVPLFQAAGVLSVEQVAAWDTGLLYKTYLVLLFLTCIVLALRAVRNAQKPKPSSP